MTAVAVPGRAGVDTADLVAGVIDLAPFPARQLEAVALGLAALAAEVAALRALAEGRRTA